MAARRALLAGLGTTGVLIACAALLLAVVGALFAFKGWPGDESVGQSDGLSIGAARLIDAQPPSFAGTPVPAEVRQALRSPRRRVSRPARRGRDRVAVAGVRAGGGGGASAGARAPGAGGPGGGSQGGAGADRAEGPRRVSEQLAGTVEQLGSGVAGVGDTATPAAEIVRDTGSAVSGTVRQLGGDAEAKLKLP